MDVVQNVLITGNAAKRPMPVGFRCRFTFCPVQFKKLCIRGDHFGYHNPPDNPVITVFAAFKMAHKHLFRLAIVFNQIAIILFKLPGNPLIRHFAVRA
ncbi:hypothetical protein SSYM_1281 [Serratia symbiotica str. Tucson]|uniref:Uncharacterized protein n=1 Tax=Serratia symbiotica str. Tucson TaxID=914128 RepID=E9CLY1_9GAMM|nr:hypothetical protein SSYM_1281 [Serratia symbiotica str. Tucson]